MWLAQGVKAMKEVYMHGDGHSTIDRLHIHIDFYEFQQKWVQSINFEMPDLLQRLGEDTCDVVDQNVLYSPNDYNTW